MQPQKRNSMLNNIEPKEVWKNFELLNAVPRASKKEAAEIGRAHV